MDKQKKPNDKYKKKNILKDIKNQWGYWDSNGDIILIKNCIKNNKYNKIYQIVSSGDPETDGIYLINSYDVNLIKDVKTQKEVVQIVFNKYDKIAGRDAFCPYYCETDEKYIEWLKKNSLATDEDIIFMNKPLSKEDIANMKELILES